MNKKIISMLLIFILIVSASCNAKPKEFKIENPNTYQKIDVESAKSLQESGEAVIIDVRTKSEYESGHIPNAVLIPLDTIDKDFENMYSDKDFIYIVYCQSGSRSKQAALMLLDKKYNYVYDFGGITNWPYDIMK